MKPEQWQTACKNARRQIIRSCILAFLISAYAVCKGDLRQKKEGAMGMVCSAAIGMYIYTKKENQSK